MNTTNIIKIASFDQHGGGGGRGSGGRDKRRGDYNGYIPTDAEYLAYKIQDHFYANNKYQALSPTEKYKLKKICAIRENTEGASGGGAPPALTKNRIKKIEPFLAAMESAVAVELTMKEIFLRILIRNPSIVPTRPLFVKLPRRRGRRWDFPQTPE